MALGGQSNGQVMQRMEAEIQAELDDEAAKLPKMIGEAVALHLAPILQALAQHLTAMPDCFMCVRAARDMVYEYQLRVQVAQRAAEPVPELPAPPEVRKAVTWVPVAQVAQTPAGPATFGASVPACWDHIPAGGPAGQPVSVGLVDLAGNPISYRRT